MKTVLLLAVVLLAPVSAALAGEIYGKITEGDRSVGEGVPVQARCGDKTYGPAKTDTTGSYHLVAQATGKCVLSVTYKEQAASIEVASYDEGTQVDLVVEMKDGKLTVRRK